MNQEEESGSRQVQIPAQSSKKRSRVTEILDLGVDYNTYCWMQKQPSISPFMLKVNQPASLRDPTPAVRRVDVVAWNNPNPGLTEEALNHRKLVISQALEKTNSWYRKLLETDLAPSIPQKKICQICNSKDDHFTGFCPYQQRVPPGAIIGDAAVKLCFCCHRRSCKLRPGEEKNLAGYCVLKKCVICSMSGDHWGDECPELKNGDGQLGPQLDHPQLVSQLNRPEL